MFAHEKCVSNLLSSLSPYPVSKEILDAQLERAIAESEGISSSENRKEQWQYLLREEVCRIAEAGAAYAEEADKTYYDLLYSRLDVILVLTERQLTEESFALSALQDLLETQSVASCSQIFSWIEENGARLTLGMQPTKGKALVLLRTLNDLLRRLSKTGSTAMLCGRILTFLSTIFPMGERSGVNLRGDYGSQWEGVTYKTEAAADTMDVDEAPPPAPADQRKDNDITMEEDSDVKIAAKVEEHSQKQTSVASPSEQAKKEEFYNIFWSLQLPFSRPPVLVSSNEQLEQFKSAVGTVMSVIKEATSKERAMMGSKVVVGSLRRKREATPVPMNDGDQKYLFPKFLTSPELLDLEIADTAFRRQFLFQLLIILEYLLQFTKEERQASASWKNKSLPKIDFTLKPEDVQWIQETVGKAYEEMRQTAPNGRAFADTIQTILEREKNWVQWKNDSCVPFDRDPLPESLEETTAPLRAKMRKPMEPYDHKLGSAALTEIWEMGYRDTGDLQRLFNPGSMKDFVSSIEKENARIKFRKQQLEKQAQARSRAAAAVKPAAPTPTPAPTPATPAAETTAPVAPVPQRAPAASPPLHPSLPAKPGTQPTAPPAAQPSPAPAPSPAPRVTTPAPAATPAPELTDPIIMKAEETKTRLSWLALRLARDEHLHHFGKIGNGDVLALVQEIEKEKEQYLRGDSQPSGTGTTGTSPGPENTSVPPNAPDAPDASDSVKTEAKDVAITIAPADTDLGNDDAKMEDADKPAEQKPGTNTIDADAQ